MDIVDKIKEIPEINYGGCGFAAIVIWHHIKKKHPRSRPKIVLLDWGAHDIDSNKNSLSKNGVLCTSVHHIAVKWRGKLLNCALDYKYSIEIPNPAPLIPVLKDHSKWNKTFDRKNLPDLAALINETEEIFQ